MSCQRGCNTLISNMEPYEPSCTPGQTSSHEGGLPMKCKSLSFSARKRSMIDACQARDESRAELLSWKWQYTSISYAACVKEPIQNSFLLILRRLILGSNSALVCQRLHESSVHVIVGLTTMFSTHGMIKFFV